MGNVCSPGHGKDRSPKDADRAVAFTERVVGGGESFLNVNPANADTMTVQVKRLVEKQNAFRLAGKPSTIDVGYHYTRAANMPTIRTHGLLSQSERNAKGISATLNGSSLGDGIYTGSNPFDHHYVVGSGNDAVGLLVARLQGTTGSQSGNVDTVTRSSGKDVAVLQTSDQCVTLVQFPLFLVSETSIDCNDTRAIHVCHCKLQSLVDEFFNCGVKTTVPWVSYTAPEILPIFDVHYEVDEPADAEDDCAICFDTLTGEKAVSRMRLCKHEFHTKCIKCSMSFSVKCPVCRSTFGGSQGKMPSGNMTVKTQPELTCSGHGQGTIVIDYNIHSGTQKSYHENPGVRYGSAHRVAYLPDNSEGRELLKRLEWAFTHGLTFTVGTSLTTGHHNVVTWSSIHHKTSLSGGQHGFPDPNYFYNVNEDLDALNVPNAIDAAAENEM